MPPCTVYLISVCGRNEYVSVLRTSEERPWPTYRFTRRLEQLKYSCSKKGTQLVPGECYPGPVNPVTNMSRGPNQMVP